MDDGLPWLRIERETSWSEIIKVFVRWNNDCFHALESITLVWMIKRDKNKGIKNVLYLLVVALLSYYFSYHGIIL